MVAHQWVYHSSDFDTTPASDESRHGAVFHRLNTSTASSFFADPPTTNEPLACSSPRRLNETQIDSSTFLSCDNTGFQNNEEEIDEIELTGGAVGGTAAAATGNAAATASDEDEDEVFNAETFL